MHAHVSNFGKKIYKVKEYQQIHAEYFQMYE